MTETPASRYEPHVLVRQAARRCARIVRRTVMSASKASLMLRIELKTRATPRDASEYSRFKYDVPSLPYDSVRPQYRALCAPLYRVTASSAAS